MRIRRLAGALMLASAMSVGLAVTLNAQNPHTESAGKCWPNDIAVKLLQSGQFVLTGKILCIEGYTPLEQVGPGVNWE